MEIDPWKLLSDAGRKITEFESIDDLLDNLPDIIGDAVSVDPSRIRIYTPDGTEMVPYDREKSKYKIPESELEEARGAPLIAGHYAIFPARYKSELTALIRASGNFSTPQIDALQNLSNYVANAIHLTSLIETDPLTGLYNHRILLEKLSRIFAHSKTKDSGFAVVFLDLDLFKDFNDRYGHSEGDAALKHLALVLENSIRTTDMVGRYGGEEFVVGFPRTSLEEAVEIGERMRRNLEKRPMAVSDAVRDKKVVLTMSVGVASSIHFNSVDDLVKGADVAMQEAKKSGRNRLCYHTGSEIEHYNK